MPARSAINIEDLRRRARRRLPRAVFDYIDGGAGDELTLRANRHAFDELTLRPRQAVRFPAHNLGTRVLGTEISLPILLAPVGYSRLFHPDGERGAAAAAGAAGTIYVLSTVSGHALEEVKAASSGPAWFQLYLLGGRDAAAAALDRARNAGYSTLVITVDTVALGNRERDLRNGVRPLLGPSLAAKLPYLPQLLARPRWLARFLRDGGMPCLPNIVVPGRGPISLLEAVSALAHASPTWEDFAWIRQCWPGPIAVKGVLSADDARRALDHGATCVIVSNHGGRQLDGAPASLDVLPEVAAAVAGRADVLLDGGIRRGGDVVKALCLGALAVLIGRPYAFGLAAYGAPGVARCLEILRSELERTLALLGCDDVARLDPSWLNLRSSRSAGPPGS